jgi:tRNA-dihydrouridine synthase B
MYSGKADWDIIREVKKAVYVPVLANGDVFEAQDAVRILKYTGADMVMIARGAMGDPWIFEQAAALLSGVDMADMTDIEDIPKSPSIVERVETALRQFELAAEQKGEKIACLEARKHYAWYLRGVPHSGYFKEQISRASTMEDLRNITEAIKKQGDGFSAF